MNFVVCAAPILMLIVLLTKPQGWPSHVAFPFTTLMVYLVERLYFVDDPNITNATVVRGILWRGHHLVCLDDLVGESNVSALGFGARGGRDPQPTIGHQGAVDRRDTDVRTFAGVSRLSQGKSLGRSYI